LNANKTELSSGQYFGTQLPWYGTLSNQAEEALKDMPSEEDEAANDAKFGGEEV
jgi:hypothetical protein